MRGRRKYTVLLSRPTAGLKPVVAQAHGPLGIVATKDG